MQRRELFSSLASSFKKESREGRQEKVLRQKILRPPYYRDENAFHKGCMECEDKPCATVCEEQIIIIGEDGTPKLDLSVSGCTFCDDCAIACEFDVLHVEAMKKIEVKIEINVLECMSWHKTMCFSCKDPCAENAIEFLGMFRPTINEEKCTSCGLCMHTCPVQAIKITA